MRRHHPQRPLRICLVTETYPPEVNGVALTLAHLAAGLRDRGHAVSVVRPRQPSDDRADGDRGELMLVPGLALPGYSEVRIGIPWLGQVRAYWSDRPPDIVYVATEGPLGWSAVRTAVRLGVPVVSGFHTNFADYVRHYRIRWLSPLVLHYLRGLHNRTRRTFVATVELQDHLRGVGFDRVSVLGRGVDCTLFSPSRRSGALRAEWRVGDDQTVALYVGRLAPEKNVPLAIESYRAMQQKQDAARFVIVGDGPLRGEIEARHPDLVFCGTRTGEGLAAHYASADVFLFPSETETFGNVALEAMASGLAVVAFDYAAAHVHVVGDQSGVLVPRGDARAFVEAAAALVRQPRRLPDMRRRAREHALAFDWPSVVRRFEALLAYSLTYSLPRRRALKPSQTPIGGRTC